MRLNFLPFFDRTSQILAKNHINVSSEFTKNIEIFNFFDKDRVFSAIENLFYCSKRVFYCTLKFLLVPYINGNEHSFTQTQKIG